MVEEEEPGSSEGSGDDLDATAQEDYRPIPELDTYEPQGIDDEALSDISHEALQAANQELDFRDTQEQRDTRQPAALGEDLEAEILRRIRLNHRQHHPQLNVEEEEEELHIDPEDPKGKLADWIQDPRTVRWVSKSFRRFLLEFQDEHGNKLYLDAINTLCANNQQSLIVNYSQLRQAYPTLALWLADEPSLTLPLLNDVAYSVVSELFPQYAASVKELYVRVRDLPITDQIRNLRWVHLFKLVKVTGVVTRRTGVNPQLKIAVYNCLKCGEKKGPIYLKNDAVSLDLGKCGQCQSFSGFKLKVEETIYRNYQKMTLQETPSAVPPGRVPRHKEVILLGDNIDCARPGEEVEVTGIFTNRVDYGLNAKHGFPVFSTVIDANFVRRLGEADLTVLTEEDKFEIKTLARKANIKQMVINSIAPSIHGHPHVKKAIALALFGGEAKDVQGKHKIRGDINVMILGDPGVAKSQFLKYIQKTAHRCVYTTGKGASAVGLTAGVHKDPLTKEWALEGGALVLADRGVCLIDEFDKMQDQDRTSIHEAMEQQSISISKAGIVASLQARCSVIAAANPIQGKYDSSRTFNENVNLSDPILSRFDVMCVVKDEVDMEADHYLATFILNSHMRSHPEPDTSMFLQDDAEQPEVIPQDLLKKYLLYAKQYVHPQLSDVDRDKIAKFYADLRKEKDKLGGVPIVVRHIESLLRMSESFAKMHLREHVLPDDVDSAIEVLVESFCQQQKYAVGQQLRKKFRSYLTKQEDSLELLYHITNKLFRDKTHLERVVRSLEYVRAEDVNVSLDQLEIEAREHGINDLGPFLRSPLFTRHYKVEQRLITKRTN